MGALTTAAEVDWKPLPWLGNIAANCKHNKSSFPTVGTLRIRSNGAKLRMAEPRGGGTREKPSGLAMVGVFSKSKAESPDSSTAPRKLQTRMIWVRAIPHCCASCSTSINLWNHKGRAKGLCGGPIPEAKKLSSNTVISSAQLLQKEKGLNASIVCLKMCIVSFLWPLLESYKGSIVTRWRVKCINPTSPHISKESDHKQKHAPFYNC